MKKIVVNLSGGLARLVDDFPQAHVVPVETYHDLLLELSDADGLVTYALTDNMLDQAEQLKYVASLYAGVDKLPLTRLKDEGIILTTGRGIHIIHMAEYAIMMMILHARGLDKLLGQQRQRIWAGADENPQDQIHGKKLGIIGLGAIGQEVAKKASLMGMEVVGVRRSAQATEYVSEVYGMEDGIEKVVSDCDYVINLLPHTPETHHLIDKTFFDLLKPSACMINMGRGDTVNEDDLYQALVNRQFKRYISDVFNEEPLDPESNLWELDNIVITPHISGPNVRYLDNAYPIVKQNLTAFLEENYEEMVNVYSHERGY